MSRARRRWRPARWRRSPRCGPTIAHGRGALDHPLEAGGRHASLSVDNQRRQVVVDIVDELAAKLVEIDRAGLHDGGGIAFVGERQKQVLERGVS